MKAPDLDNRTDYILSVGIFACFSLVILLILSGMSPLKVDAQQYNIRTIRLYQDSNIIGSDLSYIDGKLFYSSELVGFDFTPGLVIDGVFYNFSYLNERFGIDWLVPYSRSSNMIKFGFDLNAIPPGLNTRIDSLQIIITPGYRLRTFYQGFCYDECFIYPIVEVDNKFLIDFSDILRDSRLSIEGNIITIYNFSILSGRLFLDPSIILQDADTENIDDSYVNSEFNITNYGANTVIQIRSGTDAGNTYVRRGYQKYNFSEVLNYPDFVSIDSIFLWMNHTARGFLNYDAIVNAHWVNNTVWDESTINWNNQPCGTEEYFPFSSGVCGGVVDAVEIDEAGGLNRWFGWNLTILNDNINLTDSMLSILVRQNDTPTYDSYKAFATKEFASIPDRPYLEVNFTTTATTTTTAAPTVSISNDLLMLILAVLVIQVILTAVILARKR